MKLLAEVLLLHFYNTSKQFYYFRLVFFILLSHLIYLLPNPAFEVVDAMKLPLVYPGVTFLAYAKNDPFDSFLLGWESLEMDRGLNDEKHGLSLSFPIWTVLSWSYITVLSFVAYYFLLSNLLSISLTTSRRCYFYIPICSKITGLIFFLRDASIFDRIFLYCFILSCFHSPTIS